MRPENLMSGLSRRAPPPDGCRPAATVALVTTIAARLKRHKGLEDEAKALKADLPKTALGRKQGEPSGLMARAFFRTFRVWRASGMRRGWRIFMRSGGIVQMAWAKSISDHVAPRNSPGRTKVRAEADLRRSVVAVDRAQERAEPFRVDDRGTAPAAASSTALAQPLPRGGAGHDGHLAGQIKQGVHIGPLSGRCGNGPARPSGKRASISTRSPNLRYGVRASPRSSISMTRFSARQLDPAVLSLFETVPEPTMVPALSLRVPAQWAISPGKENAISSPEPDPTRSPFSATCRFRPTRPLRQAAPSSSGVSAIGAKLVDGFACRKPKPLGISRAPIVRRRQSLICTKSRMRLAAASAVVAIPTSSTTTPNSLSPRTPEGRRSSLAPAMPGMSGMQWPENLLTTTS